jgi:glycosyltransferase involved in cell wall biosynthesis
VHVLQILKFSPEFGGGIVAHLAAIGERLQAEGARVTYAFPKHRSWFERLAPYGDILEVPEILTPWRPAFHRVLQPHQFDVAHLHFSFALPLAFSVPGRARPPRIVYHWHNMPRPLLGSAASPGIRMKRTAAGWLARCGDRAIDRHLTVSGEIAQALVSYGWTRPERVLHVPNAVGTPALEETRHHRNDCVTLGAVANFRPEKDHDTLLRAFARVARSHPEARLELVGDGPTRPAMEHLVEVMGLKERVTFRGIVLDLNDAYRRFDAFVLSTHTEGHPLSLVEAMSYGLPFLATDLVPIREIVPRELSDGLVPARNPIALGAAMSRMLEMEDVAWQKRGALARDVVEKRYRMEMWTERVLSIYRAVISR